MNEAALLREVGRNLRIAFNDYKQFLLDIGNRELGSLNDVEAQRLIAIKNQALEAMAVLPDDHGDPIIRTIANNITIGLMKSVGKGYINTPLGNWYVEFVLHRELNLPMLDSHKGTHH